MSYYPEFSELLLDSLDRIDRPPAWLARRLGVNPSTVNRWLNQGSRPGDPEIIVRIADLVNAGDRLQELLVAAGYGYQEAPEGQQERVDHEPYDDVEIALTDHNEEQPSSTIPTNLPAQTIAMVGRDDELAALDELCADPTVRLVTIMGPGGMGKTKLALAFADKEYASGTFPDGVFYVPLAAISKRHNMVAAIADALGLSSSGRDMETSVLRQLQNMHALVLLDNFEQLIPEADFLTTLLDSSLNVHLIVTSRARLNLQEEWAIDLQGLSYPKVELGPAVPIDELKQFEAVNMFMQRIEQINSGYTPTEEDVRLAAEITRQVQGMPLALELAAGWTRYMMLDEIIAEIRRSMDFFSTTVRNIPERHRSLRAVFHQSWQMLTPEEQQAYAALSVFRGGFSRQAAAEVTGVSLPVIASLVDKSLISRVQAGHYEAHDMLRQFAAEILAEDPQRQSAARLAHAAFYCGYLANRTEDLRSSRQLNALHEISAELENIRAAWNAAIEEKQVELLSLAVEGWYLLAELGGYIQQGYWGLDRALEAVESGELHMEQDSSPQRRLLYSKLLARHGMLRMRYGGSYPKLISELERALKIVTELQEARDLEVANEMAFVMNKLGLMQYFAGDEDRAELLIRSALEISVEQGNYYETGNAWSELSAS